MGSLRALIACESSGIVRQAFRDLGWDVWSCDLQPADDGSPFHIKGDAALAVRDHWDLLIAHPPCTYLCRAGIHWNSRRPERTALTEQAIEFFDVFDKAAHIRFRCIENPIGVLSSRRRRPDQVIHPWQFGHDAEKTTHLWLHGLPPLVPTLRIPGRLVGGKERWSNQTDSGQNALPPSPDRWKKRSQTYPGIARAMASQWSKAVEASYPF